MMRGLWILVLFLMVGCGAASGVPMSEDPLVDLSVFSDDPVNTFDLPCIGQVYSEFPVSPRRFAHNLRAARKLFEEEGVIPEAEFCSAFEDVPVSIYDVDQVDVLGLPHSGSYSIFTGIHLERHGFMLPHELGHAWEWKQLKQVFTFAHPYWDTNGIDWVQQRYRAYCFSLSGKGWEVPLP